MYPLNMHSETKSRSVERIEKIKLRNKIPYYKTNQGSPYHKGIKPVCCAEVIEVL